MPASSDIRPKFAVVTNLVQADCTLDPAVEVAGQSREVAERHDLRTGLESQRRTMTLLADKLGMGLTIQLPTAADGSSAQHKIGTVFSSSGRDIVLNMTPKEAVELAKCAR